MAVTTSSVPSGAHSGDRRGPTITTAPTRSTFAASRIALGALARRDFAVLRKNWVEFVVRTLIQPFLLVFVFLYVFPTIGQGVGRRRSGEFRKQEARLGVLIERHVASVQL